MNLRSIAVLLTLPVAVACAEPLEFADWTIPVPEGTRIIEYVAVPIEERTERIELVEDLVIGERGDDDNYRLYNATGAKVDAEGNHYVLDAGNFRVQVFDRDGDYVRTLGGQGQGPGEFTRPRELVLAGNRVVVVDSGNRRFSFWTLDGKPLGDVGIDSRWTPSRLFGFDDGRFWAASSAGATKIPVASAPMRRATVCSRSVPKVNSSPRCRNFRPSGYRRSRGEPRPASAR